LSFKVPVFGATPVHVMTAWSASDAIPL